MCKSKDVFVRGTKAYVAVELQLHSVLTSTLLTGEWLDLHSSCITPEKTLHLPI